MSAVTKGIAAAARPKRRTGPLSNGEAAMAYWVRALKMPVPCLEYVFHPTRKWRLDFAWPEFKVAVEVDGGIWIKGGAHSRPVNIARDMEKHNALTDLGWRYWRFEPRACQTGKAAMHIDSVIRALQAARGTDGGATAVGASPPVVPPCVPPSVPQPPFDGDLDIP